MKEPSELIRREAPAPEPASLLERTMPYHGGSVYDAYPGEATSGFGRLHEYWRAVRKHLALVLGLVATVTGITAFYMARQPDIYDAVSRVQVDQETANNPGIGALKGNPIILNNSTQDPTYFNTQVQILTSAGLLSRVARTLDLEHNQAFLHPQSMQKRSIWETLTAMVGLRAKNSNQERSAANSSRLTPNSLAPALAPNDISEIDHLAPYVQMLQSDVTVKPLNDTRIIEIRFRHADSEVAAKIANAISDTFVLSNLERKTETNATAGDFLQKRIAELQSDIRQGEEELINYAKNHQILSLDASQNTVVDRLAGLNRQLLEAENNRKAAEAAYRSVLAPGALEAQTEAAANTTAATTEAKIAELKQKRAQVLLEYTEKYPEVKDLDQQISMLEKQLTELRTHSQSVVKTNLETRYREALQKEQSLREAFDKQRSETVTQNEAAVNYRIIQQEIETNKSLLDGLLQRSKENDVVLAGTPNNIHVLDYSPIAKSPIGPKRLQFTALGLLFACIFGIALARYLDYLDDTVQTSEDVERALRLPTLAVIPAVGSLTRRRFLPNVSALQRRGESDNQELLLGKDKRSPLSEAYRQLRTSVLLSAAGGAPQTLLVTSSQPGEGKTTTVVNTALVLAQTAARVIVIDADMRRPRLHSIFACPNKRGLSSILANNMSGEEMLDLVQLHQESGLHVLTSGTIPPNPAELIGSEQMQRLLAFLKPTYTHIIIDSPPIASFTDGVLMSSMADGVLLVVQGGKTSRLTVRRGRQSLTDVGAKVFGVVLNNVNLSHQDYYYRYYYQNKYYQHETDESSELGATGTG